MRVACSSCLLLYAGVVVIACLVRGVHAGVVDKHTVTAVGARPPPPSTHTHWCRTNAHRTSTHKTNAHQKNAYLTTEVLIQSLLVVGDRSPLPD